MSEDLKFKFDPNLQYQLNAIKSVVDVFDGLPEHDPGFTMGGQIVPNIPPYEHLQDEVLQANVREIQERNDVEPTTDGLDVDEGLVIKYAGNETVRYPNFTVEMETGTGKTYVYLRTMYELRQKYGFSKFVVVVPSVAIYEGLVKNFNVTRDHFRALYDNETAALFEYSGDQISKVRSFATASHMTIMVITIDSLNKHYNKIFKASEQLPGSLKPIEFIQKTRPILIFDEPQSTVSSRRAKAAARALHPLCALRYSATHRESPNLLYKLTPFDAYQKGLVKKIQVIGVTEEENFNNPYVALQSVNRSNGSFSADVKTYVYEDGRAKETTVSLGQGDDLYEETNRQEHEGGYIVDQISVKPEDRYLEFKNGVRLQEGMSHGPNKEAIFREQIHETIRQHMKMQKRLLSKGIKVVSLFFIDRVANYINEDGIIRQLFDQEFNQIKQRFSEFQDFTPGEVRSGYFAEKDGEPADADSSRKADRQARQEAYNLIMKDKERLLSFDEPVSFIFAHSALKEGWDNPNVFQICTLNQTVSEVKKRQEIGRGLRIAVDQTGDRIFDDKVNVLTVVANESYEDYAQKLQQEYEEDGEAKAPPEPTNAERESAKRRDHVYESEDFQAFFDKLFQKANYKINIDTEEVVDECTQRLNAQTFPEAKLLVQRGEFVRTQYEFELLEVNESKGKVNYDIEDTRGSERSGTYWFEEGERLKRTFGDEKLRGYRVANVGTGEEGDYLEFENGVRLVEGKPIEFEESTGEVRMEEEREGKKNTYPVFNLIDRAARETGLTRPTLNQVFKGLDDDKKEHLFRNPEGFAGTFIDEIEAVLAAHVAANIEFELTGERLDYGLGDLFPEEMDYPQKELVEAGKQGLYDKMQTDSEVEERFVSYRLRRDEDNLSFYLKFPPAFKLPLPNVIGNYNPDWGIVRYTGEGVKLELVRETKGTEDVEELQYPHEKRKIRCAHKLFDTLGIDYRPVTDETEAWWESQSEEIPQGTLELL